MKGLETKRGTWRWRKVEAVHGAELAEGGAGVTHGTD